ncbi:MAG TPA: sulfoxide reductase heme-binding subunit YedZ, partial [Candidatus Tenderia electrophaga]|nr:sulfoxide reductase heme-binding subunit YedZ [Candidatus Tenderia electrophaga]
AYTDALGANPIEEISHITGDWSLRFLLLTLTVTPLAILFQLRWLKRFRRMLGLFCFFYVCLHLANYVVLDQYFDWPEIYKDIIKRPYISVGFVAFVLLIPLAITSVDKLVEWMGKPRWLKLHQLVFVSAVLGVLHYLWLVKADLLEPGIYGFILIVLMLFRVWHRRSQMNVKNRV